MDISKERLAELQNKVDFVKGIGLAMYGKPGIGIEELKYDVFQDQTGTINEYLVIVYKGGALAARNCRGDSTSAIFEEIARLMNSGAPRDYYDCYQEGQEYLKLRATCGKSLLDR